MVSLGGKREHKEISSFPCMLPRKPTWVLPHRDHWGNLWDARGSDRDEEGLTAISLKILAKNDHILAGGGY